MKVLILILVPIITILTSLLLATPITTLPPAKSALAHRIGILFVKGGNLIFTMSKGLLTFELYFNILCDGIELNIFDLLGSGNKNC